MISAEGQLSIQIYTRETVCEENVQVKNLQMLNLSIVLEDLGSPINILVESLLISLISRMFVNIF